MIQQVHSWASFQKKTIIPKDTCTHMFIAELKQHKYPLTEEWIKKVWYVYTVEYYSAIKKTKIMPLVATCMQLEILILRAVRKKKTNTILYHLHVESKIWHK